MLIKSVILHILQMRPCLYGMHVCAYLCVHVPLLGCGDFAAPRLSPLLLPLIKLGCAYVARAYMCAVPGLWRRGHARLGGPAGDLCQHQYAAACGV